MNGVALSIRGSIWALAGLGLSLVIPSVAVFQKFLGIAGVVGYTLVAFFALGLLVKKGQRVLQLMAKVSARQEVLLTALTFLFLLMSFTVVYPIANSGVVGGGSDSDDALNIATTELLRGRYPYYPTTYLGNPITPMPGALLLAVPFVLLGNGAYQNFFWLFVFTGVMKRYLGDGRLALALLWVILALSPAVLHQLVTGSDYIANSLYVLIFMLWIVRTASRRDHGEWRKVLGAVLLGIGLSSRANFLAITPLIFASLVRNAGWRAAIRYMAITLAAFVVVTLPFYLYDPQGFSPLHTTNKLGQFESVVPLAGVVIPMITSAIALVLAFFQSHSSNALLRNCAAVLAFPILCGIVLSTIKLGKVELSFSAFGTFFLFFGVVAFWRDIFGKEMAWREG